MVLTTLFLPISKNLDLVKGSGNIKSPFNFTKYSHVLIKSLQDY